MKKRTHIIHNITSVLKSEKIQSTGHYFVQMMIKNGIPIHIFRNSDNSWGELIEDDFIKKYSNDDCFSADDLPFNIRGNFPKGTRIFFGHLGINKSHIKKVCQHFPRVKEHLEFIDSIKRGPENTKKTSSKTKLKKNEDQKRGSHWLAKRDKAEFEIKFLLNLPLKLSNNSTFMDIFRLENGRKVYCHSKIAQLIEDERENIFPSKGDKKQGPGLDALRVLVSKVLKSFDFML